MKHGLTLWISLLLAGCATCGHHHATDMVKIDADGSVTLNGEKVPIESLSESLRHNTVIIDAHTSTPHAKVIAVLEETQEAGISNVQIKAGN